MADDRGPRIEGCGVSIWAGDVQKAIEYAIASYRRRFDMAPSHVALPAYVDPAGVQLGDLSLGHPCGPGLVLVGRPAAGVSFPSPPGQAEASQVHQHAFKSGDL